ncbi:cytochrome c oxidase assembly protein [Pseudogracilibacillus auburnensis]|uniref:cytochrome c oxidase assembly protein n=1 Tax=Pseudogracilibacillus auburnensis TaxID=1494959 RepID=UPI001A974C24|nr:cytochrome c oxidase assembly protein [Pseudogracilibacillus auburnensis]MBO1002431.1 cytochrome c oxidase assembly protein [Pseudogracilibacillus auburnensis]
MFEFLVENHSLYTLFKLHWVIFFLIVSSLYRKKVVQSPLYSVTKNQTYYFMIAIILLLLLKATPFDVIATQYLFSAHTLQLSLTYFVVIPLLILSFPTNFWRQYIWNHRTKFALNILAHPWLTLITFNGLLTLYFIPAVFNVVHMNFFLSFIVQIILFINAIFMWWVMINPVPEIKGLDYLLRALYIFLASLALFPIGFFYVIIQHAYFPMYLPIEGAIIPALTLIYDQQAAGGILKITQLASYSFALLLILMKWGKLEEAKEGQVEEENIRYVRGVVIHLDKKKR